MRRLNSAAVTKGRSSVGWVGGCHHYKFVWKHQLPGFVQEKSSKSLQVPEATLSTSLCKRRRGLGGITYFFRAHVGDVLVLALCLLVFFFDQRCSPSTLQKVAGRLEGLGGSLGDT